jgi:hypothetical protein
MTGIHDRIPDDEVKNPFSPNAILTRDGKSYSVNHYRKGLTHDIDINGNRIVKNERFEIRYEVTNTPV